MTKMFIYLSNNSTKFFEALGQHLFYLTLVPVLIATIIAIPLGIICAKKKKFGNVVMTIVSIMQTIPSLALLAFMIVIGLGIGVKPAIVALIIYSLLPIVRNSQIGIQGVDQVTIDAAVGIGFDKWQILLKVELPLAVPTIIAGIKTATVTCIGTGVLAAYIGGGGLGTFIVTGLSQVKTYIILVGAIPATLLAVLANFLLGLLERKLTPKGLK